MKKAYFTEFWIHISYVAVLLKLSKVLVYIHEHISVCLLLAVHTLETLVLCSKGSTAYNVLHWCLKSHMHSNLCGLKTEHTRIHIVSLISGSRKLNALDLVYCSQGYMCNNSFAWCSGQHIVKHKHKQFMDLLWSDLTRFTSWAKHNGTTNLIWTADWWCDMLHWLCVWLKVWSHLTIPWH